jgi:hypothetical protein
MDGAHGRNVAGSKIEEEFLAEEVGLQVAIIQI